MANHRQKRGTGVRIRSEAKAHVADRLLLAAQMERDTYDHWTEIFAKLPKRLWVQRRRAKEQRFLAAVRHMQAIRSAQDVAKKNRHVDL